MPRAALIVASTVLAALAGCGAVDDVQTTVPAGLSAEALAVAPAAGDQRVRIAAEEFSLPEPSPTELGQRLSLWATHYYTPVLLAAADGAPLSGRVNQAISAPITESEWCDAALQGAVVIGEADGALTAYSVLDNRGLPQADCSIFRGLDDQQRAEIERTRFCKIDSAKGPLGCGVEERPLRALRTVAVDPEVIPIGTTLYIAEARGKTVIDQDGDERVHDGYFFAAASGGAIKGAHIDIFGGVNGENPFPSFVKSDKAQRFEAAVVAPTSAAARWLARQHPTGDCGCSPF